MGTGYTRQSSAEIQTGEDILAAPLNAEFNQLQSAFNSSTGHSHDGTSGEGPLINLTSSITGILPVANGGIAGINNVTATSAPTNTDDSGSSYAVGSIWVNVTTDTAYVCVDATVANAVWNQMSLNSSLDDIAALAKTDGNIIVGDGASWVAESGATARASLGLTIGTDVQAYDATLASIAALGTAADKIAYTTGTDTWAEADITSFGRSLIDDASASAARTTLGLVIGTNVQAFDAELAAIAGLTSAADRVPYFTGSGTAALATFTTFGRSLVDDASASAARTTLGLVIGTNVQAFDAELAAIAGLTSAADKVPYFTGSGTAAVADFTAFGRTLVANATAADARTDLDVDQAGTDNSTDVTLAGSLDYLTITDQEITRNAIDLTTDVTGDLPVAEGGTGRSSHTEYAVICGGTTTTSAQQSIASVGTTGQRLTSNGPGALPTFQDDAATICELIETQTASADAVIDFTDLSSTYFMYMLVIEGVAPASDNQDFIMRTSADNGSSFASANGSYAVVIVETASDALSDNLTAESGGDSAQIRLNSDCGNATDETGSFVIKIINPSAANYTNISWEGMGTDNGGSLRATTGRARRLAAAAVDAIRFQYQSGNIATGTFKLYGLRAS